MGEEIGDGDCSIPVTLDLAAASESLRFVWPA